MGKITNLLKQTSKRQWYWLWEMGLSKKKADVYTMRNNSFRDLHRPVFFLSTGRTGTKWFAELLKEDKKLSVFHSCVPDLAIQNKFIYEFPNTDPALKNETTKEIFLSAREEYLIYANKTQKQFVETNNQFVFFAPMIAKLIPHAIFIHLYRHPGEFVRSGVRRKWYDQEDLSKYKLITNNKIDTDEWQNLSEIEKIAWLWNETNEFIEDFKKSIPSERFFEFNFNELDTENTLKLAQFIGADISPQNIQSRLNKSENSQQQGSFKTYNDWSEEDKKQLIDRCGKLAKQYGYKL